MNGKVQKISIEAPARVHLSLIGLDANGYRINGGAGFSVKAPCLSVCLSEGDSFRVHDLRHRTLTSSEASNLSEILLQFLRFHSVTNPRLNIDISGICSPHAGFGSTTALHLACLEGIAAFYGLPREQDVLLRHAKRGSTSGIGVSTYFNGGFVFDVGRKRKSATEEIKSSEHQNVDSIKPLSLVTVKMPEWDVGICIPPLKTKTIEEENAFFRVSCPLSSQSVCEILYEIVYGITASVVERNLISFTESLKSLQLTAWKKQEWGLYDNDLRSIEALIYSHGAMAVALSSLGPGLVFFGLELSKTVKLLRKSRSDCIWLHTTPNNTGRLINCE